MSNFSSNAPLGVQSYMPRSGLNSNSYDGTSSWTQKFESALSTASSWNQKAQSAASSLGSSASSLGSTLSKLGAVLQGTTNGAAPLSMNECLQLTHKLGYNPCR